MPSTSGGLWTDPNYATQTGTTFPVGLANCLMDLKRLGNNFNPFAQATPNMTIGVDAGHIGNGTTLTEIAPQDTPAFTAPVSNPRIDRVVIDRASGALSVVAGTEASSPTPPAIPAGKCPVAQVLLTVGMVAIANASITDERDLGGLGLSSGAFTTFGTAAVENLASDVINDGGGNLTYAGTGAIASAATMDIGTVAGPVITASGTAAVTSLGDTMKQGQRKRIRATGAWTLTAGANIVILNGNVSVVANVGDVFEITCDGTAGGHNIYYVEYFPAAGIPSSPFSAKFTSTGHSLPSAAALTVAHGLGAVPFGWKVTLVNVTAEAGYTAGQELEIIAAAGSPYYSANPVYVDATNVYVYLPATVDIPSATGVSSNPTSANWSITVRAWK